MKLLDHIKHFHGCFNQHFVLFVVSLGFDELLKALRQVVHDEESATFVERVHVVSGDVDLYVKILNLFRLLLEPQRLFEVSGLVGRVELHCHLVGEEFLAIPLG